MTSREKAQERLSNSNSQWTIEKAQAAIEVNQKAVEYWNALPVWKRNSYDIQIQLSMLMNEIEVLKAIVEILTEQAEVEVAAEAVQAVMVLVKTVSKATVMRKVVAVAANKLRKLGYSLSDCFKRAWAFVKGAMGFIHGSGVKAPVMGMAA